MKTFKKVFASAMVTAMLATMGVSATASEIIPRYPVCPNCGEGRWETTYHERSNFIKCVPCVHEGKIHGYDGYCELGYDTIDFCRSCKYYESFFTGYGEYVYEPWLGG